MKTRQVLYKDGNDKKFNFYLLAEKEEITIDKNSLAFKIDPTSDKYFAIQFNGFSTGNADIVLSMQTKDGIFKGYIFCDYDDIEEL